MYLTSMQENNCIKLAQMPINAGVEKNEHHLKID
jgi:hypothetical protein